MRFVTAFAFGFLVAAACGGTKNNNNNNGDPDLSEPEQSVDMASAQSADLTTTSSKKRLFVTKASYTGNLGGLSGADAKCSAAATTAGLGGAWKAWISDGTTSAKDRLTDVGPWYDAKGLTELFANKAALTGSPAAFVRMYEDGSEFDSTSDRLDVWTGTNADGTTANSHCQTWTYDTDNSEAAGSGCDNSLAEWSACSPAPLSCDSHAHLYCFEQ